MGMLADVLRTPVHRRDIQDEVEWAEMGYRLWTEHRDALEGWARSSSRGAITDKDIENWWLGGQRQSLIIEEETHLRAFLKRVPFTSPERRLIDARMATEGRALLIYRIREHLDWIGQLSGLHEMLNLQEAGGQAPISCSRGRSPVTSAGSKGEGCDLTRLLLRSKLKRPSSLMSLPAGHASTMSTRTTKRDVVS